MTTPAECIFSSGFSAIDGLEPMVYHFKQLVRPTAVLPSVYVLSTGRCQASVFMKQLSGCYRASMSVRQALRHVVTAAAISAQGSAMRRLRSETAGLPFEGPAVQADMKVCHRILPSCCPALPGSASFHIGCGIMCGLTSLLLLTTMSLT